MKQRLLLALLAALALPGILSANHHEAGENKEEKALRGLLLAGGCCHDYDNQKTILSAGISERLPVDWTIVHEGGKGTKHQFDLLKEKDWGQKFDFVVYDICFAHEEDSAYIDSITATHKNGLPAIALHCTMHTYHWRAKSKSWTEFLGAVSPNHGKHAPIKVSKKSVEHPVMKNFPKEWTTPKGELYNIDKMLDSATVLAEGTVEDRTMPCIWVNQYGKARVFATTLGHHNETMSSPEYLNLLGDAVKWITSAEQGE